MASTVYAEKAIVVATSSCDYFVASTNDGYTVAESNGDADPDKGNILQGNFNAYGARDYYNDSKKTESRMNVEDYQLKFDEAERMMWKMCE